MESHEVAFPTTQLVGLNLPACSPHCSFNVTGRDAAVLPKKNSGKHSKTPVNAFHRFYATG